MSNHDQLASMRAFIHVVDGGTFTRAAALMHLPKTTVTRLIQALEDQLSVKLLQRTTRQVKMTDEGAAYYARALQLIEDLDALNDDTSRARVAPSGRLRIDMSSPVAHFVIPALPGFFARYPDVQLEIGVTDRQVDLLGDDVQCVLRAGTVDDESLVGRKLADFQWVTCATPDYLARYGTPLHPDDLNTEGHFVIPYFSHRNGELYPLHFRCGTEIREVRARHRIAVGDGSAYLTAGLAGLGLMQAMHFMVSRQLDSGELVSVLDDWQRDRLALYVLYPRNRHASARLRLFIDWLVELFAPWSLRPDAPPIVSLMKSSSPAVQS